MAELRVPATEVARRARHGVAVLLKIYAHCIDGQADAANTRINEALGTRIPSPTPLTRAMRATARMSRHHEAAGQRQESGWAVSVTAPTVSSVDFRPLSVDFSAPKFGAHGRIADDGTPETSLDAHNRRSAGGDWGGASGL